MISLSPPTNDAAVPADMIQLIKFDAQGVAVQFIDDGIGSGQERRADALHQKGTGATEIAHQLSIAAPRFINS